jgi:hypothetical protein
MAKENLNEIKSKGFMVYYDWEEAINEFDDKECAEFLKNMFRYGQGESEDATSKSVRIFLKLNGYKSIDMNEEKYFNKVMTNRENGKNGGRPTKVIKKTDGLLENPTKPKEREKEKEIIIETIIEESISNKIETKSDFKDLSTIAIEKINELLTVEPESIIDPFLSDFQTSCLIVFDELGNSIFDDLNFLKGTGELSKDFDRNRIANVSNELRFIEINFKTFLELF